MTYADHSMKRILLHLGAWLLSGVVLSACASSTEKAGGIKSGRSSTYSPTCFSPTSLFPGAPGCGTPSRLGKNQPTP